MLSSFALLLALVVPPDSLSLEAGEHNTQAMRFYDAGQLAPAFDEFYAAYQLMPDARRDLPGRELLLGSMRSMLRALHAETGDPAPLCRLRTILRIHADALLFAFPDDPSKFETRGTRARHDEVTQQLAAFGPDVCKEPEPEPEPALLPVTRQAQPPVAELPAAPRPGEPVDRAVARDPLLAGAVILPLGVVALGVVGVVAHGYRRGLAEADALHAGLAEGRYTEADRDRMRELLPATRRDEKLMIALGITGAALVTAGAALLVRGASKRRRARLALGLGQRQLGLTITGAF